jgi:hypothetical protein
MSLRVDSLGESLLAEEIAKTFSGWSSINTWIDVARDEFVCVLKMSMLKMKSVQRQLAYDFMLPNGGVIPPVVRHSCELCEGE